MPHYLGSIFYGYLIIFSNHHFLTLFELIELVIPKQSAILNFFHLELFHLVLFHLILEVLINYQSKDYNYYSINVVPKFRKFVVHHLSPFLLVLIFLPHLFIQIYIVLKYNKIIQHVVTKASPFFNIVQNINLFIYMILN